MYRPLASTSHIQSAVVSAEYVQALLALAQRELDESSLPDLALQRHVGRVQLAHALGEQGLDQIAEYGLRLGRPLHGNECAAEEGDLLGGQGIGVCEMFDHRLPKRLSPMGNAGNRSAEVAAGPRAWQDASTERLVVR